MENKTDELKFVKLSSKEKTLEKIDKFQNENLEIKKKKEFESKEIEREKKTKNLIRYFSRSFVTLCEDQLNLNRSQISQFNEEDIKNMNDILDEITQKDISKKKLKLWFLPIFGWLELNTMNKNTNPGETNNYAMEYAIAKKEILKLNKILPWDKIFPKIIEWTTKDYYRNRYLKDDDDKIVKTNE